MVKKKALIYLFITIMIPFGFALDLDSLIASYDYDYTDGNISVNSISDVLVDSDFDNISDSLVFNILTSNFNSNYTIGVILDNENYIADFVSLESNYSIVTIPSYLLSESQYNYSVEIRDEFNSVVFRQSDYETSVLSNYESGYNLDSVSEFSSLEDGVSFVLNFSNIPSAGNKSITLFLDYLDGAEKIVYTSNVKFVSSGSGFDSVIVSIPSDKIFASGYSGNFILSSVLVDSKRINLNYSTKYYNYFNFTDNSYILNLSYFIIDSDLDFLIDSLVFKFPVSVANAGDYRLEFSLFDSNDEFVGEYFVDSYLNIGGALINYSVYGEEFYRTKINGPFKVSNVVLKFENSTVDVFSGSVVTSDISYYDFEKPSLPDLVSEVVMDFNSSKFVIVVSNEGDYPAFNFDMNVYGSNGFEFLDNIMFLDIGDSVSYNFSFNESNVNVSYSVNVDSVNFVDEVNESNNYLTFFHFDQRDLNETNSSSSGNSSGSSSGNSSGSNTSTSAELNVISGKLSIGAPSLINFGEIRVSSSEQVIEINLDESDYFMVEDLKALENGYYTTLSISDLVSGKKSISAENVELKTFNVSNLAGSVNLNVITSLFNYSKFTSERPVILIERKLDSNGIVGKYGVLPSLKVKVPAYQAKGKYTGILTYTLIEN